LSQADFSKNPVISFSVLRAKKDSHPFGWLSFLFALAELVLCSPGYESDERSLLGLSGFALPVADAAKPLSVQRSVCNAAGLSARRTLGTANRAAEQTTKIFRSGYYRVLPPQPTLRTEKDIGSKSPRNHNGFWVFLCHFSKCNSKDIVSPKRPLDRT